MKVDIHFKAWGNEEIVLTEKIIEIEELSIYRDENGCYYKWLKNDEPDLQYDIRLCTYAEIALTKEILTLRDDIATGLW